MCLSILDPVPDLEHNSEMTPDLERASEEASRLFVDIYEKLETRKVNPAIDFKSLVEGVRSQCGERKYRCPGPGKSRSGGSTEGVPSLRRGRQPRNHGHGSGGFRSRDRKSLPEGKTLAAH